MFRHVGLVGAAARTAPALLFIAFSWHAATAAPAPFDRSANRAKPFTRNSLVGTWTLNWSGHPYVMTLSGDGNYSAQSGGMRYYGSWRYDAEGFFWITESTTP